MERIINENKTLTIEYEGKDDVEFIRNLWSCRMDQSKNVLEYNTKDNTMEMKQVNLDDISAFHIARWWQVEGEPKNTRHSEIIFNWEKDFDKNFRRRWE